MANLVVNKVESTAEMTITESALLTQYPFFAYVLYNQLEVIAVDDEQIATAGTDGYRLYVNVKFFASLSGPERVFLYAHEILHAILLHMVRGKFYADRGTGPDDEDWSHKRWNFAADYVINDALIVDKVGKMPKGGLHDKRWTHESLVDDVYIQLLNNMPPPPPNGPGSGQPGDGDPEGTGFDVHIMDGDADMTEAQQSEMEVTVKQAVSDAKSRGKLPGAVAGLVESLLNPKVKWGEVLFQEMCKAASAREPDWSRPKRRSVVSLTGAPRILMPSVRSYSCGTVVITMDTSGSIDNQEASMMLSEAGSIIWDFNPEEVYILWVDSRVAHVDYLDDMNDFHDIVERCANEPLPGGGGTDMTETFDYIEQWGIEPNTCVIFTDGYTPFGEAQDYPVVWGVTVESQLEKVPHGVKVHVDITVAK